MDLRQVTGSGPEGRISVEALARILDLLPDNDVIALGPGDVDGALVGGGLAYFAFDGFRAATMNWQSFSQIAFAFDVNATLLGILGSPNVASKHWVIRQYDHEVQGGSVVKPLVGPCCDGPGDAAVIRPRMQSRRGLVLSCGMNPYYGDFDTYHMAASAIDEVRGKILIAEIERRAAAAASMAQLALGVLISLACGFITHYKIFDSSNGGPT